MSFHRKYLVTINSGPKEVRSPSGVVHTRNLTEVIVEDEDGAIATSLSEFWGTSHLLKKSFKKLFALRESQPNADDLEFPQRWRDDISAVRNSKS